MNKYILAIFGIACSLFIYSGCLKSDHYLPDPSASPVIRIPNSNWPAKDAFTGPPADSPLGVKIVNLYAGAAFANPLDQPVTVTFEKDDAVSAVFLDSLAVSSVQNGAIAPIYAPLPADCYSAGSYTLTIPAGATVASLPVTVNPANFSGMDNYIISFSIKSVTGGYPIAGNFKSMVFTLQGY